MTKRPPCTHPPVARECHNGYVSNRDAHRPDPAIRRERLLCAIGDALERPATDEQQVEILAAIDELERNAADPFGVLEALEAEVARLKQEKATLMRELGRFTNDA